MSQPVPVHGIISAAGYNKRLLGHTHGEFPKVLTPLTDGTTVLDRLVGHFANAGIPEVVVTVGYLGNMIKTYVKDHSFGDVSVQCLDTGTEGGNAHALYKATQHIAAKGGYEHEAVLFNDQIFHLSEFQLAPSIDSHIKHGAVLSLTQTDEPEMIFVRKTGEDDIKSPNGELIRRVGGRITDISGEMKLGMNISFFIMNIQSALQFIPQEGDFFSHLSNNLPKGRIHVHRHHGYWGHITDEESLASIHKELQRRQNMERELHQPYYSQFRK